MSHKILVLDTSILCVWLKVPGMETCGSDCDRWDYERINEKINNEIQANATLVLPIATIIETGNHITHAKGNKYHSINSLCDIIIKTADKKSPWAAFSKQSVLWKPEGLKALAERWREHGISGQSIGDASIVDVANYYSKMSNHTVEILTADAGLNSYQPSTPPQTPRRRQ